MKTLGHAAIAALALTMGASPALHAQEADYILATASTGGTYYPVGVALATLVKVKLQPGQGIGMSAISSAGSAENISLMRDGEAQFGILQGLYGYYAASGTGPLAEVGCTLDAPKPPVVQAARPRPRRIVAMARVRARAGLEVIS